MTTDQERRSSRPVTAARFAGIDAKKLLRYGPPHLAATFGVVGAAHFVIPGLIEEAVPPWLPRRRLLVYLSGVAELACAIGLIRKERWAGKLSAAVLLAVWPGNFQMAIDARRTKKPLAVQAILVARLPMQIPMIRTALSTSHGS